MILALAIRCSGALFCFTDDRLVCTYQPSAAETPAEEVASVHSDWCWNRYAQSCDESCDTARERESQILSEV